jgi:uncharacterized membrane protein
MKFTNRQYRITGIVIGSLVGLFILLGIIGEVVGNGSSSGSVSGCTRQLRAAAQSLVNQGLWVSEPTAHLTVYQAKVLLPQHACTGLSKAQYQVAVNNVVSAGRGETELVAVPPPPGQLSP